MLLLVVQGHTLRTTALEQKRLKLFLRWGGEEFKEEKSQMKQVQRGYEGASEES